MIVRIAPFSFKQDVEVGRPSPLLQSSSQSSPSGASHEKPLLFVSSWQAVDFISFLRAKKGQDKTSQSFNASEIFNDFASTAIITGSHDKFEIATSQELLETLWPNVGSLALHIIAKSVAVHLQNVDCLGQPPFPVLLDHSLSSSSEGSHKAQLHRCTSDVLVIQLAAGYHRDLPKAISWVCAALRRHPENTTIESGAIHKSDGTVWEEVHEGWDFDFMAYGLNPLKTLSPEEYGPSSCWTQLFTSSIAVWHSIPRPWGKGLGMSFAMLCHLSASREYLWISDHGDLENSDSSINPISEIEDDDGLSSEPGGYILGGFRTAAVPMQRNSNDQSQIQWHLERIGSDEGIIDHSKLEATRGEWLKIQDLAGLQRTKVFLGWCREAEILLGTSQLTTKLRWSTAEQRRRTLHRTGYSVGVSSGPAGMVTSPAQLAANVAMTVTFVSNIQAYKPSKEYAQALSSDCEKTALVIDYRAQRAFLVPKLSLALHLCRIEALRAHRRPEAPNAFPTAVPSVDGSGAAHAVLRENGDRIVVGVQGSGDATSLELLFLRIHHALTSSSANCEPPQRLALYGTKVYGRELRALIERPDEGIGLSVVQDIKLLPWVRLAELADVRCVCSDLGSAIRPVLNSENNDCQCCEIPRQRYLLSAHLWCLEKLLRRKGSSMSALKRHGKLDFGDGYVMRWKGCGAWERSHSGHQNFWQTPGLLQYMWKETSWDAKLRVLIGTDDRAATVWQESPGFTGAFIFGV
ncbi:hypothetical protein PG995_004244 [Apiospora arundinis]